MITGQGEPVVSIGNVSHFYGSGALRKQVLYDITAELWPGEIVIVTGPSGSGKTTMLTLIGALRHLQQGSLRALGTELQDARPDALLNVRQQIGYIFQSQNLLEALSACQNVQMSFGLQGFNSAEARSAALEMLAAVGLEGFSTYFPRELSGGQRQRVAIARALVRQPRLILADEPTSALDKESGRNVIETLRRLARRRGSTVLIVTHDNRILDAADRVMQLDDGHLGSFAEPISTNAVHLLTALARLPAKSELMAVWSRLSEQDLLELLARLGAEAEQFLNALEMGTQSQAGGLFNTVLECAFAKVADLLRADEARLFSIDRERNSLRLRASAGVVETQVEGEHDDELAIHVAETGQVLFSPDTGELPGGAPGAARDEGGQPKLMYLPLRDRLGRLLGVSKFARALDQFVSVDERTFRDYARVLSLLLEVCGSLERTSQGVSDVQA